MTRLLKRDVERLLTGYDNDPVAALTAALRKVLDLRDADWAALLDAAPLTDLERAALLAGSLTAYDALARELNELRDFDPARQR